MKHLESLQHPFFKVLRGLVYGFLLGNLLVVLHTIAYFAYPTLEEEYFPAMFAVMVYSIIFGVFYYLVPLKKFLATFWIPYIIYGLVVYLYIASELDWHFKIMTLDYYMILGLILPLFGIVIFWIGWFIYKRFQPFKHLFTRKQKIVFGLKCYVTYQLVFSGLIVFYCYYWLERIHPTLSLRIVEDHSLLVLFIVAAPSIVLLSPILMLLWGVFLIFIYGFQMI